MSKHSDILSRLPELPLEPFELSAKLDYSEHAPVITNRFEAITVTPATIPTPHAPNRSSHETRRYFAWILYPHVVCTPVPDLEVMARVNTAPGKGPPPSHAGDLAAIADTRLFFKLTKFRGTDLATPWGCEVRYGPWFGIIDYTESCSDAIPDHWVLYAPGMTISVSWEGAADDMPSVPNLTVLWDPGQPASVQVQCCPGFYFCNGGCIPNQIPCPGHVPA